MPEPHTATLIPKPVGDLRDTFFVPSYQRGYRWGRVEVTRLLDDIAAARGRRYYLQPIVVKRRDEKVWELVDGQQRLTTLYLITKYISGLLPAAQPLYRLEYETRDGSADYLNTLDVSNRQDNIDYFHMFEASQAIEKWFADPSSRGHRSGTAPNPLQDAIDFYTAFTREVHVIWYEADADVNSAELFSRLNVGRIPLTDAELVKALLLAQIRAEHPARAHEVAAQWDSIERELRDPEIWAFISGRADSATSHIGLVLDVMASHVDRREAPLYETFEKLRPLIEADAQSFWNDVVDVYSHIIGWYYDREIYHLVGFLVTTGNSLLDLWHLQQGATKNHFRLSLRGLVRRKLGLTRIALTDLNYSSTKTSRALLLMNIQTVLAGRHSAERYSFHGHAAVDWSLEHIHAQNAESLNTEAQWSEWIRRHIDALESLPESVPAMVESLRSQVPRHDVPLSESQFRRLQVQIIDAFAAAGQDVESDINSIDNLALLALGDNSALSNSVFAVKRRDIIQRDREGAFIPPCTRNVFLKYYTPTASQQLHFWGPEDREAYREAMVSLLGPYLVDGQEEVAT